jgi:hypothetical protein
MYAKRKSELRKDKTMNTDLTILTCDSSTGADSMPQTLQDLQSETMIYVAMSLLMLRHLARD